MKMFWVGISLLVATVAVGVACGPKERYCYDEKLPCSKVKAAIDMDAAYEAPDVETGGPTTCGFTLDGSSIPCE